jgi:hypothetical protein
MLHPKPDESFRRRALTAAAMLLPVAMWLGLRFAFFGGIGGTYATAGYTPLADFLRLTLHKLTHLHYLFIAHKTRPGELPDRGTALLILDRGTALLIYAFLCLWALRILPQAVKYFRYAMHETRWPTVDAVFLVALWAAIALAFHFALPLPSPRYATSVVVFAWPALVAEVERRGKAIFRLGLVLCSIASLTQSLYYVREWIAQLVPNEYGLMNAALRQTPLGIRQIYVLSAGGLPNTNPEYMRLILGVSAKIVRVVEITWKCREASDLVDFNHSTADGVVSLTVSLPTCANFVFYTDRFKNDSLKGRLNRNDTMSYDLPEVYGQILGRRITVHIRPNGRARFIIEHGGPDGVAWFDTPDLNSR